MSHDLQFQVHNGVSNQTTETAMQGELDHLPSDASSQPQQQSSSLEYLQNKLAQSSHPNVMISHIIFKGAAIVLYTPIGKILFPTNELKIPRMVSIIMLVALDFWVVKNITGRFLVGLRWWNKVEGETTTWIFESAEDKVLNRFDKNIFWFVLMATPLIWISFLALSLFNLQFEWMMVLLMAIALSGSNVYGYFRCSREQKAQFQQMMQNGAQQGAMYAVRHNMLGFLTGTQT